MTVHKVQGKTLDSGVISAGSEQVWEAAQAYTAFSRFRKFNDFEISNLKADVASLFYADAAVEEFRKHIPASVLIQNIPDFMDVLLYITRTYN